MTNNSYTVKVWSIDGVYDGDVDWYNNSNLQVTVDYVDTRVDSGWCDSATGAQIVTSSSKIEVTTFNEQEEVWLLLKFGDRALLKSSSFIVEAEPLL